MEYFFNLAESNQPDNFYYESLKLKVKLYDDIKIIIVAIYLAQFDFGHH